MSKDKAGKKDKWKHLDLFDMMLKQSQVFRDMVEHFQSAWTPQAPSVRVEASVGTRSTAKKPGKAAKAPSSKAPARKSAVKKKSATTKKPAVASGKASTAKSTGKTRVAASQPKPVTARKSAGKATATRRATAKK